MVLEGSISKVTQDLDEMRLKEQKIEEEIEQLMRKRATTDGEKERVALRLGHLLEKASGCTRRRWCSYSYGCGFMVNS